MGIPVTVDSDDLEMLLFATGAIKAMEAALVAAKRDPLAERAKPRIAAAHDALNAAMLRARRKEQFPQRFRDATPLEIAELKDFADIIASRADAQYLGMSIGALDTSHGRMTRLAELGFVELGAARSSTIWGGGDITTKDDPLIRRVRLTQRGKDAVEAAKGSLA